MPITRDLPCNLTHEEWAKYAAELAETQSTVDKIEGEKKIANDVFKERLQHAEAERRILAFKVRTRQETREVACEERWIEKEFRVELIRLDTREVVSTRPMTTFERDRVLNPPLPGVNDERHFRAADADADDKAQ